MTRVLVTGAWGYIGGRTIEAFAGNRSLAVTAASRQMRRVPPGVAAKTVDWSDASALMALCRDQDAIIHLAAMNEGECARDADGAKRVNSEYTKLLLQAATAAGVRRFIVVSTAKVFGDNPTGALDELTSPHPASAYAITHHLAEKCVLEAQAANTIEGIVLRLSNAVGAPADPHLDAWMLIANDLCRQVAVTGRIMLKSSGLAWRNFIAMSDVVAALRHVLVMPRPALDNGLFHLGGPQSARIRDLATRVAGRARAIFGRDPEMHFAESVPGESCSALDWRVAKLKATGWKPANDLDSEIDATLTLCRTAFTSVS